ncbi:zinc finger BED domain-containing protein RICESLEEPER 1-like [Andrographis paniculata]|uniref:zinc finger BED domain-containing protein RICESLEEPER 1-like n=1 Tax=Andrographis paniculata TaxID=175694 RepID=UPI0021E803A9|nr:zinc finger BED domain-containing protein RICESLEEPER 1-like [Andrographis paniculata]
MSQSQFQPGSSTIPTMESADHLVEQVPIDEGEDDEMHDDVDLEILADRHENDKEETLEETREVYKKKVELRHHMCGKVLSFTIESHSEGIISIANYRYDHAKDGIKYLCNSEAHLIEFSKIKKQLSLSLKKLFLDCPIRWNRTYMMLASALQFKDMYIDVGFLYVPTEFEWSQVEDVCQFLGVFHDITNVIYASEYPKANIFFPKLYRIKELLNEKSSHHSSHMRSMALRMKEKFDKYWGESNMLISLGAILDPRYKMELVDFAFPIIYGEDEASTYVSEIKKILYDLYDEYVTSYTSKERPTIVSKRKYSEIGGSSTSNSLEFSGVRSEVLTGKANFNMHMIKSNKAPPQNSDLDFYLSESRYDCDANANLDVLGWWKGES